LKISLRGLRANKNLSQTQVAEIIGVTKETISNWERYKTSPDIESVLKLCKIYDCELDNIFLPDKFA